METQGERVKLLRKHLNLSGEKFGEKLGVTKVAISNIERGNRSLTDQMLKSICREFNVNEKWLRKGIGEMFLPLDRYDEISRITHQLLTEEKDSFKNRFISILANLSIEEWKVLESFAERLYENSTLSQKSTSDAVTTALDIDKKVEEYRRELELEARAAAESGVSGNGRKNA
ncbi:MAG: helix-turn-helix transcriptional regulator [Bacilli bacterium]|nr:helix-turn-helix transcriptional regulator [Bacilli bacterium]